MKKLILAMLGLTLLVSSCSKEEGKTQASLKLSLGGITNMTTGLGSGGILLFGRSASGETFGKQVAGTEENLLIPNGDWMFYAFMWEQNNPGKMMNGIVRCAKTPAKLGGTDVTLNFNLTNANCSDPELSNGRQYVDPTNGKIRFADIFLDECDEMSTTQPWYCGGDNQGSAVSYRFKFQNFRRGPGTPFDFGPMAIVGKCSTASAADLFTTGLDVNFPSGNGMTPFIASVELFLGSSNCDPAEAKGMHNVVFEGGLGNPAGPAGGKLAYSNQSCSNPFIGTINDEKKINCEAMLGTWTGSSCINLKANITNFVPAVACASGLTAATPALKHIVSIPKNFLCDRYFGKSSPIGFHPFAGGNGTIERPYKICNEWQINQIGEFDSDITLANKSYKLMNDLDMNKTDEIAGALYENPKCVGESGAEVENHHNFNPLDKINHSSCSTLRTSENTGFTGTFLGNNKIIRNARISAKNVSKLGFTRQLGSNASIRNLNFINLEVRGTDYIGGIVGDAGSSSNLVKIKIVKLDVEGESNGGSGGDKVGGIVGNLNSSAVLADIRVLDARVQGRNNLGGIVGLNTGGKLFQVGFSGIIDQWDSNVGTYVGGLIGYSQSTGSIERSFSEGVINSSANYTGGLLGKLNTGNVTAAYSTMVVTSRFPNPNVQVGGLVGYNSGNLTDVFFDGVVEYTGGGTTPIVDLIGSGGTKNNCYANAAVTGCSALTYSDLRSTTLPAFTSNVGWIKFDGSIPRFVWEQRECGLPLNRESIANQIANNRGVAGAAPIIICTTAQFAGVTGNYNYALGESLNLSHWSDSNMISQLNGNLDGRGSMLYGLNLTMSGGTPEKVGIFRQNNGSIFNLKIAGNRINNSDGSDSANGILVGVNYGNIFNVGFYGNKISAPNQVGLVAGENTSNTAGINNISIKDNTVEGTNNVGSVAGYNSGDAKIKRVSSKAVIRNLGSNYNSFGGIAGGNASGVIDQTEFGGRLEFNMSTSTPWVGGIVGVNDGTGVVSNSYTENQSTIRVMNANTVGGLVGMNYNAAAGAINHSFALGKVIFDSANTIAAGTLHPLIGSLAAATANDLFYLQNNIASLVGYTNIDSCGGAYPSFTADASSGSHATLTLTPPANAANAFSFSNSGGGGDLSSITSLTISSDYIFSFNGSNCYTGPIDLYQRFNPSFSTGVKTVANFADVNMFLGNGYDIAYEDRNNPANNIKQDALIEFHLAKMEGRAPKLPIPIWEHSSEDDHPRLLQLDH